VWGLSRTAFTAISEEEAGLLDRVASTAASDGDEAFRRWRALYQKDRRLVVPDDGRWCARTGPGPRQAPDLEPGHRRMDERLGEPGAHRSSGKARAARHG